MAGGNAEAVGLQSTECATVCRTHRILTRSIDAAEAGDMLLATYLREHERLTGVKLSCRERVCTANEMLLATWSFLFAFAPYFAGGDGGPAGLGLYLTGLLVVAFVAASIRPRPFLRIRVPAFAILLFTAIPWMLLSIDKGDITVLLIIGSGWWLLVHAQALHTSMRGFASKWNAGLGFASTAVFAIAIPIAVRAAGGGGVAWNTLEGWIPLGLAALCMVTVFQVGTGFDAIRPAEDRSPLRRRERAVDLLSLMLWVETAVLLFVAAGLLLEGSGGRGAHDGGGAGRGVGRAVAGTSALLGVRSPAPASVREWGAKCETVTL